MYIRQNSALTADPKKKYITTTDVAKLTNLPPHLVQKFLATHPLGRQAPCLKMGSNMPVTYFDLDTTYALVDYWDKKSIKDYNAKKIKKDVTVAFHNLAQTLSLSEPEATEKESSTSITETLQIVSNDATKIKENPTRQDTPQTEINPKQHYHHNLDRIAHQTKIPLDFIQDWAARNMLKKGVLATQMGYRLDLCATLKLIDTFSISSQCPDGYDAKMVKKWVAKRFAFLQERQNSSDQYKRRRPLSIYHNNRP